MLLICCGVGEHENSSQAVRTAVFINLRFSLRDRAMLLLGIKKAIFLGQFRSGGTVVGFGSEAFSSLDLDLKIEGDFGLRRTDEPVVSAHPIGEEPAGGFDDIASVRAAIGLHGP